MRKSDQEKAEIRRETEARRQAGRNRSDHDAARGKKMPSLADLSKNHFQSEHVQGIVHEIENQSDRGAALVLASLVEYTLRRTTTARLAHFPMFDEVMLDGDGALLGSFYRSIKFARALGVIGPQAEVHFDVVRRVRNQFAHTVYQVDFQHPAISAEIDKLPPDSAPLWMPHFSEQRRRYALFSLLVVEELDRLLELHREDKIPVWIP